MAESSEWYQDPQQCKEMIDLHGSASAAARAWGIPERRVRYWNNRHQLQNSAAPAPLSEQSSGASSVKISDDEVTLISAANPRGTDLITPEEMLEEVGLNPAEWSFKFERTKYDALAGDGKITTLHRIMIKASKRPEALLGLNIEPGWVPQAPRPSRATSKVRTIALFSDPHFPMHEPALIDASLAWLADFRPDEIVLMGDNSDASPFKRHTKNPRTDSTVSEHQTATYKGLANWRSAAPDARMRWIRGNHDSWHIERIREMMPHFEELMSHPESDVPLLSLRQIFGLDTLHIEMVGEETGNYHDDTLEIAPGLVALHGVKAGRDGAVKEQAGWEGASVAQGHCHKWQITGVTKRLPGGGESQRFAINVPAMSKRDLGYSPAHDVAQGWMVITLHDNGLWVPEMAVFDPQTETTMYRDWIYQ